mmetsp:Transcript_2091/g.7254  ORF Transcript_2091/g.7254 Transcript_2091/m.7254 type:complete len:523 (-) Transcript_2091:139-1707(-)
MRKFARRILHRFRRSRTPDSPAPSQLRVLASDLCSSAAAAVRAAAASEARAVAITLKYALPASVSRPLLAAARSFLGQPAAAPEPSSVEPEQELRDLLVGVGIMVLLVLSARAGAGWRRRSRAMATGLARSLSCPALLELHSPRGIAACAQMMAAFDERSPGRAQLRRMRSRESAPSLPVVEEEEAVEPAEDGPAVRIGRHATRRRRRSRSASPPSRPAPPSRKRGDASSVAEGEPQAAGGSPEAEEQRSYPSPSPSPSSLPSSSPPPPLAAPLPPALASTTLQLLSTPPLPPAAAPEAAPPEPAEPAVSVSSVVGRLPAMLLPDSEARYEHVASGLQNLGAEAGQAARESDAAARAKAAARTAGPRQSPPHVVVLGDERVGKSTVVGRLRLAARTRDVPLRVHEGLPACLPACAAPPDLSAVSTAVIVWTAEAGCLCGPLDGYVDRYLRLLQAAAPGKPPRQTIVLCNRTDECPCPLPEIACLMQKRPQAIFLAGSALRGTNMAPLWRFVETCAAPRLQGA